MKRGEGMGWGGVCKEGVVCCAGVYWGWVGVAWCGVAWRGVPWSGVLWCCAVQTMFRLQTLEYHIYCHGSTRIAHAGPWSKGNPGIRCPGMQSMAQPTNPGHHRPSHTGSLCKQLVTTTSLECTSSKPTWGCILPICYSEWSNTSNS